MQAVKQYQNLTLLLRGENPRSVIPPVPRGYIASRLHDLAKGTCLGEFTWNGGGSWQGRPWSTELLTDSALVFYMFAAYLEVNSSWLSLQATQLYSCSGKKYLKAMLGRLTNSSAIHKLQDDHMPFGHIPLACQCSLTHVLPLGKHICLSSFCILQGFLNPLSIDVLGYTHTSHRANLAKARVDIWEVCRLLSGSSPWMTDQNPPQLHPFISAAFQVDLHSTAQPCCLSDLQPYPRGTSFPRAKRCGKLIPPKLVDYTHWLGFFCVVRMLPYSLVTSRG